MADAQEGEVGVFVPAEAVFPGIGTGEAALVEVLKHLSRTDALFWCGRLNLIVSGPGNEDSKTRQEKCLHLLCTQEEIDRINTFVKGNGGADRVSVFLRGQLLELMRWVAKHCSNLPGDGETFNDPKVRQKFVQAALLAGELWGTQVYPEEKFSVRNGDIEEARLRALGPIRKGIEGSARAPDPEISLGRGEVLFSEHFPPQYPAFAAEFHEATGLSIEEYRICVTAIVTHFLAASTTQPLFNWKTSAAATPFNETFPRYVLLESQTADELTVALWSENAPLVYRKLRERPIFRTEDGRAIVLDPVFFSERASIGPLFHLLPRVAPGKANEIFGAFGLAFEDYVHEVFGRMYPSGAGVLVSRFSSSVQGTNAQREPFEVDGILDCGTELVIFEVKASWVREDQVLDGTPEEFLHHLRSKYGGPGQGTDATAERVKGVGQLARIVGAIAKGEWKGDKDDFAAIQAIHPVLLVHDDLLGVPVYGQFLANEFMSLLGAVPSGIQAGPLTVMSIRDLENLEESIREFGLCDLLADYSRECPDRVSSLHDFIALSEYRTKMRANRHLAGKAIEIIARCGEALFSNSRQP